VSAGGWYLRVHEHILTLVNRWLFLESGVDKIMNHLRDGIDLKTYMSLYTAIHNFCTAQKAVGSQQLSATHRGGKADHNKWQLSTTKLTLHSAPSW